MEDLNWENLIAGTDLSFNDTFFANSLAEFTNLRDSYTGSGSGLASVSEELEPVAVSELLEEYGVFDLDVYSYVGSDPLTDFSASVDSFNEYIREEISGVVNPDAANWETTTVADNSLLAEAVSIAIDDLVTFQDDPEFLDKLETAYGENILADEATEAIESLINGEANTSLEIVQIDNLETNAAFATVNSTIYLSQDFIEANQENPENVSTVILEEWGHYLDSILNDTDTLGDEGAIFANLVKGYNFDLDLLQSEDDSTILDINGEDVLVEQTTDIIPLPTSWVAFEHSSGAVIGFRRDATVSALTDIYYNGVVYENYQAPINLGNGQFSIVTTNSSSSRTQINPDGTIGFRSGFIQPQLTVNAPQWTRIV